MIGRGSAAQRWVRSSRTRGLVGSVRAPEHRHGVHEVPHPPAGGEPCDRCGRVEQAVAPRRSRAGEVGQLLAEPVEIGVGVQVPLELVCPDRGVYDVRQREQRGVDRRERAARSVPAEHCATDLPGACRPHDGVEAHLDRAVVLHRLPSSWTKTHPCSAWPRHHVWPDRAKPSLVSRGSSPVRTTCASRCSAVAPGSTGRSSCPAPALRWRDAGPQASRRRGGRARRVRARCVRGRRTRARGLPGSPDSSDSSSARMHAQS